MKRLALFTVAAALLFGVAACGEVDQGGGPEGSSPAPTGAGAVRCASAGGAPDRGKVSVRAGWSAGDEQSLLITKTRSDSSTGDTESSAPVELRVLTAGPNGSRLRWQVGNVVLPLVAGEIEAGAREELERSVDGLTVEYTTGRSGAIRAVANLAELRTQAGRLVDALKGAVAGDREAEAAIERSRQLVLSDAFLQTALIEDIGVLHGPYGFQLTEGESREIPYEIGNPFGGPPIPATAELSLISAETGRGCAVVELEVLPRPTAMRRAITEGLTRASGRRFSESELDGLEVRNTLTYTYDRQAGVVVRAEAIKEITIGDRERTDSTVITVR